MAKMNLFTGFRATDCHVFCATEHVEVVNGEYTAIMADSSTDQACIISQGQAGDGFQTSAVLSYPENNFKRMRNMAKNGVTSCGYMRLETQGQSTVMDYMRANEFFKATLPWFVAGLGCLLSGDPLRPAALIAWKRIAALAENPNNVSTVIHAVFKAGVGRPDAVARDHLPDLQQAILDLDWHIKTVCEGRRIVATPNSAIPIDPLLDPPRMIQATGILAW